MIKTVSFAPPRSARVAKAVSKSASNPTIAQPARVAPAATPTNTQPARASSGSSAPTQVEENSAAPRRRAAITKTPAPKIAVAETAPVKVAPVEATPVEAVATTAALKTPAPKKPRVARVAPATAATPPLKVASAAEIPAEKDAVEVAEEVEPAPATAQPVAMATPKIKRSRAPKDLALQYGAAPVTEDLRRNVIEKPAPRKRLTREAKAARSQMLKPDDDVLQRLQQANAIEVKKPASRGRGWEFECGRCGRISRFQTPGAICQCGAIAVRE